ncbi:stretch-activated cation channel mid1 [Entomortierella beljakovae]|nr:stretch-activated cation channel mid1 [Entomortierella beljakovae]
MLHSKRIASNWMLLSLILCCATTLLSSTTFAQSLSLTSATPSLTSTTPSSGPSQIPIPPPPSPTPSITLPPGTRELRDGQAVADKVALGQLQTYHFTIVQGQQQHLSVRRQLELVMYHSPSNDNNSPLVKRQTQQPSASPSSTSETPASVAPAPTRTMAPIVASPFPNGTYSVFISISTCSTPRISTGDICPPLVMYVSTSSSNPLPGPGQGSSSQMVTGHEGLIQFTAYTDKDVFFSLEAPPLQGGWTGEWAVEVGASSQGYVQNYDPSLGLILDDTDSTSASFLTHNFTAVPTFKAYLLNTSSLPRNLSHSLCAIETIQPIPLTKTNMVVTQTNRISNLDGSLGRLILPPEPTFEQYGQRRQVLIQLLTPGVDYTAFFITDVLNQAGAEVMYAMTPFKTKRHDNCLLVTDLEFCQEVAYAVPITPQSILPGGSAGAPNSTTHQDLKNLYDEFTRNLMDNFNKVLSQYDCANPQYSLIRNCTDCTRAYRRWLCSVSIPRCTDVEDVTDVKNQGYIDPAVITSAINDNTNPYLIDRGKGPVIVERNTTSSRGAISQLSQNPLLNPGSYGEVLPCVDLCFDVVQSCPTFLGFNCPVKNLAENYARMNPTGFQCNGLGVVPVPSGGRSIVLSVGGGGGVVKAVLLQVAVSFLLAVAMMY